MTTFLNNYLSGEWQTAGSVVNTLLDPVTGEKLATTCVAAQGLEAGFSYARK